nr:helix-turn-helix domain-containing protein [uncultured Oscillibacter sp.]
MPVTRDDFIREMDQQLKLVRTEHGFTQDAMAQALGLSKKTLVQIEKGRASLGWMGAAALASIFAGSQVLAGRLGGEPSDIIQALAFQNLKPHYPRTMGGRVWWRTLERWGEYRIQQNILSQHYRALDGQDGRVFSSFDLEEVRQRLAELEGGDG